MSEGARWLVMERGEGRACWPLADVPERFRVEFVLSVLDAIPEEVRADACWSGTTGDPWARRWTPSAKEDDDDDVE